MLVAKKKNIRKTEAEGPYFLKLVLYLILGSQWIWLVDKSLTNQIPLPVGLVIGLVFARHDHFQIDRKIEYAVLLVTMFVGYWSQVGLYVTAL